VHSVLHDDGVWMIEMSYLPSVLEATAYDVICHEHLEYYALRQIEWLADRVGLTVVNAKITDVYGGSLCVVLAKQGSRHHVDESAIACLHARETELGLNTLSPFEAFAGRVRDHREQLRDFLDTSRKEGKLTLGYGASTKGNVILQYCGIGEDDLPCIGEVDPDKSGCFTPGTGIPIVSESEAKVRRPDQLLLLPWIFQDQFVEREREFLSGGGKLVVPLPTLSTI
jgi:NDP-4-keto-2,6-dideoxyhexose 3-C-methyltransferase